MIDAPRAVIRLAVLCLLGLPAAARAQDSGAVTLAPCRLNAVGPIIHLADSCATDASIVVPDGTTFDGHGHTIWVVDPEAGRFRGGVLVARGGTASIINTIIAGAGLGKGCGTGAERLRGIYFDGASGIIRNNTIDGMRRDASACNEGIGVEVRHEARGGPRIVVEIEGNRITRYQKSGVLVHGDVEAHIHLNEIGSSDAQQALSANAVQIGPRAAGRVVANSVAANTAPSDGAAGTGVLVVEAAPGAVVSGNMIMGGDVGIYVLSNGAFVEDNQITDAGPDGAYDVGIVNLGENNVVRQNAVRGYRTPYYGLEHAAQTPGGMQIE